MDFLEHIFLEKTPQTLQGQCHSFHWQWLGEGLLSFTPNTSYKKSVVFSAGIHGNETAPIELLVQICQDIFAGLLPLNVRLLLVLGNPRAIRQGVRYIENDMNRMFYGKHLQYENSVETQRAQELEVVVKQFFEHTDVSISRYHYDLHTAIRRSLFQTFALLPYQKKVYDQILIESLAAAEIEALVYHREIGSTFTSFTSAICDAASVTLELGAAKPLGQNDLTQFTDIDSILRLLLSAGALPSRKKSPVHIFKVKSTIIKRDDDFRLNLSADAPNFSSFQQGELIASQRSGNDIAEKNQTRILFPNIHVKKGLRAGLILEEVK